MRPVVLASTWLLAASATAVCPLPNSAGRLIEGGAMQVAWRSVPAPLVVGRSFSMQIAVCPATARLVAVDATMPEHGHGMNYRPSVHPLGGGRWRADGLLWHMSGRWELRLDLLDEAGAQHVLRESIVLR